VRAKTFTSFACAAAFGFTIFTATPSAQAATITEPRTGVSVTAPKGYKLTYANSVFSLAGKAGTAQFTSVRSPLTRAATRKTVLSGVKAKKVSTVTNTAKTFLATAKVKRRPVTIRLRTKAGVTQVVVFRTNARAQAKGLNAKATPFSALDKILRSATGQQIQDFNIGIPTKRYQVPVQNGASATVPNLPGWQYGGTDTGYIYGAHPEDGAFEFGGTVFVSKPGAPTGPGFAVAPLPADPAGALVNAFPAYKALAGTQISIDQVTPITPADASAGFLSQYFEARLSSGGSQFRGIFKMGISDYTFTTWILYFSYAIERINGPSGILSAELGAWSTWNNSAASLQRMQEALRSISETRPVGGGPIDEDVFQNAADAWNEYIRGPQ